jgi:hypothetical protein
MLFRFELSTRSTVAQFGLAAICSQAANAECADHWTTPPDEVAQAFCAAVDTANGKGTVPVLRKPICPKNGPSSKCNPSSMVLPEIDFSGLVATYPDGSYSLATLGSSGEPDPDGYAAILEGLAEQVYQGDVMIDAAKLAVTGSDWQISDPAVIDAGDNFQAMLLAQSPWVPQALNEGASVFYVIQKD